jgi:beta-galactosidase/beta-glucuronidase
MTQRSEYPRPQLVRQEWQNLNGTWQFDFDDDNAGTMEKWFDQNRNFSKTIEVPFAYQTPLSGIHDPAFHDFVWYKRNFQVDEAWMGKRVWLHFGAVDYRAWVYVNGQYVGMHEGGHTPFQFDITDMLNWTDEQVVVRVEDPSTDETIPRGKQFWLEKPDAIWYTRTTGIWQTVWLEPVQAGHLARVKFQPDLDRGDVVIELETAGVTLEATLGIEITFKGSTVVKDQIVLTDRYTKRSFNLLNLQIFRTGFHRQGWTWTPETPNLFDVVLTVRQTGQTLDEICSYFGLRKVHIENGGMGEYLPKAIRIGMEGGSEV